MFNYSAGPAMLPEPVVAQVADDMHRRHQSGQPTVMEVSHRGEWFSEVAESARNTLAALLGIAKSHTILFLQGGASAQFAILPLNLRRSEADTADYLDSGYWSRKAAAEAKRFIDVSVHKGELTAPDVNQPLVSLQPRESRRYVHITTNETIDGVEIAALPKTDSLLLVADMSSNILSRPEDFSQLGLAYAGAQKNIGPAGLTVLVINNELLDELAESSRPAVPAVFDYTRQAHDQSMLNTPCTFAWYVAGLVFNWIAAEGGVTEMNRRAVQRSEMIYTRIDESAGFYQNRVPQNWRSRMNITFFVDDDTLTTRFIADAEENGLMGLKGHRLSGGIRASLYNAMPVNGARVLAEFMTEFQRVNG